MKKRYVRPRCLVLPCFPLDPLSASADGGAAPGTSGTPGTSDTPGTPGTQDPPLPPASNVPEEHDPYVDDRTWL